MKKRMLFPLLSCIGYGTAVTASALAFQYVVKKNDNLSQIAQKYLPGPVWGKHGSLSKLLDDNRSIQNPNRISIGQALNITRSDSLAEKTATPSPVENEIVERSPSDEEFKRTGALELTPFYGFTAITSTDTRTGARSTLSSSYHFGIDAAYSQRWSEEFQTFVHLHLGFLNFDPPTDTGKTLVDSGKLMSGFGLGAKWQSTPDLQFAFFLADEKEIFARTVSNTSVTVDNVSVVSAGTKISDDLVHLKPFIFGVSGLFKVDLPTTTDAYSARFGTTYGGSVYLKQGLGAKQFQTELAFFTRAQDTSVSQQRENDLMLSFHFELPVGRREEDAPR